MITPKTAATNNPYLLVEFTGAGYDINVRIFIHRVLQRTVYLTTKQSTFAPDPKQRAFLCLKGEPITSSLGSIG